MMQVRNYKDIEDRLFQRNKDGGSRYLDSDAKLRDSFEKKDYFLFTLCKLAQETKDDRE